MNTRTVRNSTLLCATICSALATMALPAAAQTVDITSGVTIPQNAVIYALTSNNLIYQLRPGSQQYIRLGRIVPNDGGNVIGIDFRPADRSQNDFYALTDKGNLYIVRSGQAQNGIFQSDFVSGMNPRFTAGYANVMDFNPVANALRVTGNNEQNLAVTNSANGQNLGTTVVQSTFFYAPGDVNAGRDPEIVGGAYNNNFVGAANTLFFMVDHDKDTLVTIADKNATGSSNTGGGRLQTVGQLVLANGQPYNVSPTADFDIFTDNNNRNFLVGQSGDSLISIDLSQINPNLALGQTQNVVVQVGPAPVIPDRISPVAGGVFDIAIPARQ